MANLLMALSFLLIFLEAFQFGFRYGLVNRTFYALSPSLIETSIATPGLKNGASEPYFEKIMLENIVIEYLLSEFDPHIKKFTVGFYYYSPNSEFVCTTSYCQGVAISLKTLLIGDFVYDETLTFEIIKQHELSS
jgi:hypothetical protein